MAASIRYGAARVATLFLVSACTMLSALFDGLHAARKLGRTCESEELRAMNNSRNSSDALNWNPIRLSWHVFTLINFVIEGTSFQRYFRYKVGNCILLKNDGNPISS